jgi:hypothetical protein
MLTILVVLTGSVAPWTTTEVFAKRRGNSKVRNMDVLKVEVPRLLRAFQEKNDIGGLKKAVELMETLEISPTAPSAERETFYALKLQTLLMAWNQLDAKVVPNFDFSDVPEMSVAPPAASGLPAGVDPSSIKDPDTRLEYEKQLVANRAKTVTYNLQSDLREVDQTLAELFRMQLASRVTWNTRAGFETLIDNTIRSKARADALKAAASEILKKK